MKTYVTIGYCENASEIVYAGEIQEIAMNINLYPNFHAFNVDVWEGKRVGTYYTNKKLNDNHYDPEDSRLNWEWIEQ